MNIIDVKNNLVKLCYEEDLVLAGFIQIDDINKSYLAQVLHLESTRIGKVAIAKIIFNYTDNTISTYDGSIPSLRAKLTPVDTSVLLNILDKTDPLILGKLTGQQQDITVNTNILKDNSIICAEKFFATKILLNNIALQLQARNQKIVVFDTVGIFKTNRVTLTKDFKLPLNCSTINYIYEKGFEDATAESKSLIQSIFEELSEYSKTVDFIPFDTFKAVVDSEFMKTRLIQLVVLKNKIRQIRDWNVFAQNESDFETLKTRLQNNQTVVIDISCVKESLQKECIKYVYSILQKIETDFYAFTPLTNENSDRFLLKQVLDTENVHTTTICGYDYKYLTDLKKCSKNMIMFIPLKQQKDFGGYNVFLQRLAEDEFIAYGKMTKFVPLIGKLYRLSSADISVPSMNETYNNVTPQTQVPSDEISDIPEDMPDDILDTPQAVTEPDENQIDKIPEDTTNSLKEEQIDEVPEGEAVSVDEIQLNEADAIDFVEDIPVNKTLNGDVEQIEEIRVNEIQENKPEPLEEIQIPETTELEEIEITEEQVAIEKEQTTAPEEPIDIPKEPITAPETKPPVVGDEIKAVKKEPTTVQESPDVTESEPETVNEVEEALNSVPDIDEEDELSDDDLDMIENLSKPDDEIPVINQEQPETVKEAVETIPPQAEINSIEDAEDVSPAQVPTKDVEKKTENPEQSEQIEQESDEKKNEPEITETTSQKETNVSPAQEQAQTSDIEKNKNVNPENDDEIKNAKMPDTQKSEPLQTRANTSPVVPVYSSDIPDEDKVRSDKLQAGDKVIHQEFGEGIVEKMINYGDKVLCSVNFPSVGRRLLNPEISEMRKI